MRFYMLIIGTLCVWRITHLFQAEDGPGDVIVRFRQKVGQGFWGKLVDCFYCLSIWIAAPFAVYLGEGVGEKFLLWPALSAGAILLERIIHSDQSETQTFYFEDEEDEHVMLRKTESKVDRTNSNKSGFKK